MLALVASPVRVPRQARAVRTRAELVDAGAAEFARRGYAGTTADAIAARAGVSVGTFYQYFRDKGALLREVALAHLASGAERTLAFLETAPAAFPSRAALLAEARSRFVALVGAAIEFHRANPRLLAVLRARRLSDPMLDAAWRAGTDRIVDRIETLLARWAPRVDAAALAPALFALVDSAVVAHVARPRVADSRLVAALVRALLVLSFGTDADTAAARSRPRGGAGIHG
jgi:AcrR family transcriptional regulator